MPRTVPVFRMKFLFDIVGIAIKTRYAWNSVAINLAVLLLSIFLVRQLLDAQIQAAIDDLHKKGL